MKADTPDLDETDNLPDGELTSATKPSTTMPKPSWWLIVAFAIMFAAVLFVIVAAPTPTVVDNVTSTTAGTEDPVGTRAVPSPDVAPVEVSTACAAAAQSLRDLAVRTPSALALDPNEAAELTEGLAAIGESCDAGEYRALTEVELSGWLLAPPGA